MEYEIVDGHYIIYYCDDCGDEYWTCYCDNKSEEDE